jgi:IS5 family transposase
VRRSGRWITRESGGLHDPSPPDDPGNPTVNFRGEKRSNDTHASTTDPESRLMRKGNGKEAKLSFMGHALTENRNGPIVAFRIREANGRTRRAVALQPVEQSVRSEHRMTFGADRGYDTRDSVAGCRERNVTPHVAMNAYGHRSSAIDRRTTASRGYSTSQRIRKRVEEIFGWMKTIGGLRKTRCRGIARTQLYGTMVAAAYNLLRVGCSTLAGAA